MNARELLQRLALEDETRTMLQCVDVSLLKIEENRGTAYLVDPDGKQWHVHVIASSPGWIEIDNGKPRRREVVDL